MKDKTSDEFRAFDDAVRNILSVPYRDLQAKLKQEARNKAKKRRATSTVSRASSSRKKRAA